jgi:ribosomal protein S18 acetylase RimI-like enzyme
VHPPPVSPASAPVPTDERIHVRDARPDEVVRTAWVHRRSLPGGFFARLGPRFLARYHATFAASSRARLLVAERRGEVVGFLAGTVDNAEHYRTVLRHPVGLVLSGLRALLTDPRLALEFVRTRVLRYSRAVVRQLTPGRPTAAAAPAAPAPAVGGLDTEGSAAHDQPEDGGAVAVLTHVAVREDAQGSGAGRALVEAFTREVRRAGAREVRLVTAVGGGATRFYRRLGWTSRGTRRAADGTVVEEFARRP